MQIQGARTVTSAGLHAAAAPVRTVDDEIKANDVVIRKILAAFLHTLEKAVSISR